MKYREFKDEWSKKFNALPLKAAFGKEQFERMMKEWGLTTSDEDLKKIASLGYGAFCLRSDVHLFNEHWRAQEKAEKEFFANDDNLKDAFIEEMWNHECGYTWEFEEAIKALDLDPKHLSKREKVCFEAAKKEFINNLKD